jgi:hypothetical protein
MAPSQSKGVSFRRARKFVAILIRILERLTWCQGGYPGYLVARVAIILVSASKRIFHRLFRSFQFEENGSYSIAVVWVGEFLIVREQLFRFAPAAFVSSSFYLEFDQFQD